MEFSLYVLCGTSYQKKNESFHKIASSRPKRDLTKLMEDRFQKVKEAEDEREREEAKRTREIESSVYRSAVTSRYARKYSKSS